GSRPRTRPVRPHERQATNAHLRIPGAKRCQEMSDGEDPSRSPPHHRHDCRPRESCTLANPERKLGLTTAVTWSLEAKQAPGQSIAKRSEPIVRRDERHRTSAAPISDNQALANGLDLERHCGGFRG